MIPPSWMTMQLYALPAGTVTVTLVVIVWLLASPVASEVTSAVSSTQVWMRVAADASSEILSNAAAKHVG